MLKLKRTLALLLCCTACAPVEKSSTHPEAANDRWAIYYDSKLPASTFEGYSLVVFDRRYHPDFATIKPHTVVLAYVSIGEAHEDLPAKGELERGGALKATREHWGSSVVDMTSPGWKRIVLAEVDDALNKGFDGVMLDTVDSSLQLASQTSSGDEKAARAAAVSLIRDIRAAHPDKKIMLNRGFAILPEVAPALDYALAESTLVQTDVSTGQSHLYPANSYQLAVSRLKEARQVAPQLKIYTLDYWNQDDVHGLQNIYAIQRAQGFNPYVSTPDLRRYTPEPAGLNANNEPSLKEHHDA